MSNKDRLADKKLKEEWGFGNFIYLFNNNHFDRVIDDSIKRLELQLLKLENEEDDIENSNLVEMMFLELELMSSSEMKIVHAYKHFEHHLKYLINASYNLKDSLKYYKWESIVDFFKNKSIDFKSIINYSEVNELREVNNAIKHSHISKSKIIPQEFFGKEDIMYTDILLFYKRIEDKLPLFFKSLYEEIKKDLYVYDEQRLDSIVEQFSSKMDNNTLERLILKLNEIK